MATMLAVVRTRFFDDQGRPLVGGKVYSYEVGTTTPKPTFSDPAATVPNTNPVILDDAGSADIYLSGVYSIRIEDADGVLIESADDVFDFSALDSARVTTQQPQTGSIARSQRDKNGDTISTADFATANLAAAAAYAANASLLQMEPAVLVCNPTAGDDIKAMALWCAANSKLTTKDGSLTLQIADGLHDISTFIEIVDAQYLSMVATAAPDMLTISSISYTLVSGNTYTATVGTTTALPAHVVVGYAVGCQNVKSSDPADGSQALNGAHIITSIAANRLSFTCNLRVFGAAPAAVVSANLQTATTQGLVGCALVVPKCCIRANSAGWNGSIQEGWLNALRGGRIDLTYIGMSYIGTTSEHDILFANGQGSAITLVDQCVIAGCGDKVLRAAGFGQIYANRCCIGGGTTGQEIFQGAAGASAHFIRCTMGGTSASGLTATINTTISGTQNILANTSGGGIRTTFADASATFVTGRVVHCNTALQATNGVISVAADVTLLNCSAAFSIAQGDIYGNPVLTNTANANTANVFAAQGGAWVRDAAKINDPTLTRVGSFAALIAFSGTPIPANSFLDRTITATGVALNDHVFYTRNGATEPTQSLSYQAFVSAADQITLRIFNNTGSAITKTDFTARFGVLRLA